MTRGFTLSALWLLILPVLIAAMVTATPRAYGQPDPGPAPAPAPAPAADPAPAGSNELQLDWHALGLARGITLEAANINQDFTMPVPLGFTPSRLRGIIHAPVNFSPGFVEVNDDRHNFLAAVNLPPVTADQAAVPFDVDISAAHVGVQSVKLSFTLRQIDSRGQICGPYQQLAMSDLATVFTGSEPAPTTIATFFPPLLERITIYTPFDADKSEQQGVLTLVSTLTRLYVPQPVAIRVVNQARGAAPPPAGPLTRAVVVERGQPGYTVTNPGRPDTYLRLAGQGDGLATQVSLLVNQMQSLAQVVSARVDQPASAPVLTADTATFSQLNMSGKSDVLRTANLSVGVDRSVFGSRIDSVRVHMLARYTPVAKDDSATIMVRSNGIVMYNATLNDSGRLDATFDLPAAALTQRIALDSTLTYTPHVPCSPIIAPMNFQIDPLSTLTVRRDGRAIGGFGALPSEFSHNFLVALDGSTQNQLDYAARVIVNVARITTAELTPQVVDVKNAADAKTGALIVANSNTIKGTSLNPPVSGDGSTVKVDGTAPTDLRINVDQGVGSIQAFADQTHGRTVVLVTTTAGWPLVDPLFSYIDGLREGWSDLNGDALVAGAQGTVQNVSLRSDDTVAPLAQPKKSATNWTLWGAIGIGGVVLLAILLVIALLLWRRRRRTPTW